MGNSPSMKRDALTSGHFAAYAVGHFSNDLGGAMLGTYLIYFIQEVVKQSSTVAGLAILCGQIADGITTPIVGFASDKFKTRLGRRAPYYIFGSLVTLPSLLVLFISFNIPNGSLLEIVYYLAITSVYNVGWAGCQISHMSVVNSITYSTQRRDRLISLRNAFTFIANIFVLGTALLLFALLDN